MAPKATSSAGAGAVAIGSPISVGTNRINLVENTALGSFTHLVVYTKSSLVEQSTPGPVAIADVDSSVSSVAFPDKDLDGGQLGGVVTWSAPAATAQVVGYNVYFSQDDAGASKSLIGGSVLVGTNAASVSANTALAAHTHVTVYTLSSLAEQTTPVAASLADSVYMYTQTHIYIYII